MKNKKKTWEKEFVETYKDIPPAVLAMIIVDIQELLKEEIQTAFDKCLPIEKLYYKKFKYREHFISKKTEWNKCILQANENLKKYLKRYEK